MESPKTDTYIMLEIDCCGLKFLIIDLARSRAMHPHEFRECKKYSKRVGKIFSRSHDGAFTCPQCKTKLDLSKPDEKYREIDGVLEKVA